MQCSLLATVLLLVVVGCSARELRQAHAPKASGCPGPFLEAAMEATKSPKYNSSVAAACAKSEWGKAAEGAYLYL